jgi:putative membrane protein
MGADMKPTGKLIWVLLIIFLTVFIWSAVKPYDRFTWALEVFPAIIGLAVLAATYHKFRFTELVYVLICLHACILFVGGHYTYAEVPLFNYLRDNLSLSRNYYDRLGHFAQGFVPAMIAREMLLRTSPLKKGKWLFFVVICVCMTISAFYELFEWRVAVATGSSADAFLGAQGDVWDTQWDMTFCFFGALAAMLALAGLHDSSLAHFQERE